MRTKTMQVSEYTVESSRLQENLRLALIADLHDADGSKVLAVLKREKLDVIAIAGDLVDRSTLDLCSSTIGFLRKCASLAPTFYSLGNHERILLNTDMENVRSTGAMVLDNTWTICKNCAIGGLSTDAAGAVTDEDRLLFRTNTRKRRKMGHFTRKRQRRADQNYHLMHSAGKPDLTWIWELESQEKFRILLCHHPEYYSHFLTQRQLDLILAGHAHGGHIRLFGRALVAPGQGFFPEYSAGVYDGRMIVSRGLSNPFPIIPRLGNPTELVFIRLVRSK